MNLLDLSLLGLLADQPLHGYELSKRMSDLGRGTVSYGALYPALNRLDRRGLITIAENSTASNTQTPMTGSLGAEVARLRATPVTTLPRSKRKRKVYTITQAGRVTLHDMLVEPSDDDRVFAAQFACAALLTEIERHALLERRRRVLADRLDQGESRRLDQYRRALRERDRLSDEAELAWLESLITAEQSAPDQSPEARASASDLPLHETVGGSIS